MKREKELIMSDETEKVNSGTLVEHQHLQLLSSSKTIKAKNPKILSRNSIEDHRRADGKSRSFRGSFLCHGK